jgi:hypothetical protein
MCWFLGLILFWAPGVDSPFVFPSFLHLSLFRVQFPSSQSPHFIGLSAKICGCQLLRTCFLLGNGKRVVKMPSVPSLFSSDNLAQYKIPASHAYLTYWRWCYMISVLSCCHWEFTEIAVSETVSLQWICILIFGYFKKVLLSFPLVFYHNILYVGVDLSVYFCSVFTIILLTLGIHIVYNSWKYTFFSLNMSFTPSFCILFPFGTPRGKQGFSIWCCLCFLISLSNFASHHWAVVLVITQIFLWTNSIFSCDQYGV